jgi:hypothetical protein
MTNPLATYGYFKTAGTNAARSNGFSRRWQGDPNFALM